METILKYNMCISLSNMIEFYVYNMDGIFILEEINKTVYYTKAKVEEL